MKKEKSKLTKTVKPDVQAGKLSPVRKKAKDIAGLSDADRRSLAAELLVQQIELELDGRELKQVSGEKKDVCERLDAHLRELANYKILISEINDLVYICDAEGNILFVNPIFEKLTGHRPEKFIGKSFETLFDQENMLKAKDAYVRTLRGESPRYELCFKDTDVVCEYKNIPWKDKSGNIIGVMGVARDITEHQQSERMHALFTAIMETTTDFIGYADAKTTHVRYINSAGRKMVGIGENEDVTGMKIADFHPDWTNKLLLDEAFPAAARDGVWRGECALIDREGREIPVMMVAMAHKDAKGRVEIFSTISRDISERKHVERKLEECNGYLTRLAEERMFALVQSQEALQGKNELCGKIEASLRQSENVYRGLVENAPDGIFLVDDTQRVINCNQQAAMLFGYKDADELAGKTIFEFVSVEEHQRAQTVWQQIMEKGSIRNVEFAARRKDGACFPIEMCVNTIADQEGKPRAQISIVRDITERKRMEQKLVESEQRFRVLVETCKEWIWYCDTKGRYIYSNVAVEAILGFPADEFMGDAFAFLHEDDRKRAENTLSECVARKTGWSGVVLRWRHRDGAYRYLECSAVPVFDKSGALAWYWGVSRDITGQKESEGKIKRLSAVIEQSVNIVFIADSKGQIEYVNPMFERITGYAKAEVIGQNPRILNSGETSKVVYEELWKTVLAGKTWKGTFKNKKKDGRYYLCESAISPVCDDNGQITHFLCVQEDVTEKKEMRDSANQFAEYSSFDGLTGLYNRTRFTELLEEWVSQAGVHKYQGALLMIDIDKFRLINDTYGNKIGDDLLQRIAGFLQVALAEIDMKYFIGSQKEIMESLLCRMGGDEFAIFLSSRDEKESLETADEIRRRLELFQFEGWTGHITISIGVVLYPAHGLTLYDLCGLQDEPYFAEYKSRLLQFVIRIPQCRGVRKNPRSTNCTYASSSLILPPSSFV